MDPNYDDHDDFFGIDPDGIEEQVREYLRAEWMVDLDDHSHDVHEKALLVVDELRGKTDPRNIAGEIAMKILPIIPMKNYGIE